MLGLLSPLRAHLAGPDHFQRVTDQRPRTGEDSAVGTRDSGQRIQPSEALELRRLERAVDDIEGGGDLHGVELSRVIRPLARLLTGPKSQRQSQDKRQGA